MGALNLLVTLAAAAGAQAAAPPPAAEAAIPIPPVLVSPPRVVPPTLISPPPPATVPPPRAEVHGQIEVEDPGPSSETIAFSRSGPWHIRIDPKTRTRCFIAGFFDNGTGIRVILDAASKRFSFAIGNKGWSSLEDGDRKPLYIYAGSNKGWSGQAQVRMIEPIPFLVIAIPDPAFLKEMTDSHLVNVSSAGRNFGSYTYSGFGAAMEELARCQQTVEHAADSSSEPPAPAPFDRSKAN